MFLAWNSLEYLASQRKQAVKARSIIVNGDSVIKHVDKKNLSQQRVLKFLQPRKTTGEIAEAVDSVTVATDPSHVIIHNGMNNLPTDSTESCAAKIKNLAMKVKSKYPNTSIGISRIV